MPSAAPSHRLDTPTRHGRHRALLAALTLTALAAATGITALASPDSPTPTPRTPAPATPVSHDVDVAVAHTLVAATRLTVFDHAAPGRREVVLVRAQSDVRTALAALGRVDLPDVRAERVEAMAHLRALAAILADLAACADSPSPDRPGKASTTSPHAPAPSAKPACSISSEEVGTAQTAGTAVAALIPYGSMSETRLRELSAQVQEHAEAEASAPRRSPLSVSLPKDLNS